MTPFCTQKPTAWKRTAPVSTRYNEPQSVSFKTSAAVRSDRILESSGVRGATKDRGSPLALVVRGGSTPPLGSCLVVAAARLFSGGPKLWGTGAKTSPGAKNFRFDSRRRTWQGREKPLNLFWGSKRKGAEKFHRFGPGLGPGLEELGTAAFEEQALLQGSEPSTSTRQRRGRGPGGESKKEGVDKEGRERVGAPSRAALRSGSGSGAGGREAWAKTRKGEERKSPFSLLFFAALYGPQCFRPPAARETSPATSASVAVPAQRCSAPAAAPFVRFRCGGPRLLGFQRLLESFLRGHGRGKEPLDGGDALLRLSERARQLRCGAQRPHAQERPNTPRFS